MSPTGATVTAGAGGTALRAVDGRVLNTVQRLEPVSAVASPAVIWYLPERACCFCYDNYGWWNRIGSGSLDND